MRICFGKTRITKYVIEVITMTNIKIREATHADIPAIARVHVDSWRTTYKGILPDHILAGLTYEERERLWDRILSEGNLDAGVFCYVAEDESGEVIGFASGGPERTGDADYKGEINVIHVRQAYQGQGIGHRL